MVDLDVLTLHHRQAFGLADRTIRFTSPGCRAGALNRLFKRITAMVEAERRFTADAALALATVDLSALARRARQNWRRAHSNGSSP